MFLFLCVLLGFPQGFLSSIIFSSQSFKRMKVEVLILALCFKRCVVFDDLGLFAQSIGCPKRLIEAEPDKLLLKDYCI